MRLYALFIAVLIYALFSSPTPDNFGVAEMVMGAFLCAAAGVGCLHAVTLQKFDNPVLSYHRLFFLWMASVPLVTGVLYGNMAGDIIRDFIPILFLVLPLCFAGNVSVRDIERFSKIVVLAGVLFSLRYLWVAMPSAFTLGWSQAPHDMLYLANSALVPFAAIMGFGWLTKPNGWHFVHRGVGLLVCAICVVAMIAMMQRAPLALVIMACGVIAAIRVSYNPLRIGVIIMVLAAMCYPLYPLAAQVFDGLVNKTVTVGWNNRLDELEAVRHMMWRGDILTVIFGYGWGHLWQSPAVSGEWVRFTHNMMGYYWLKAGIVGLALSAVFFILWVRNGIFLLRHNVVIALAILVPLIIHSFLYTGFKTLDYAILILLLSLYTTRLWPLNQPS